METTTFQHYMQLKGQRCWWERERLGLVICGAFCILGMLAGGLTFIYRLIHHQSLGQTILGEVLWVVGLVAAGALYLVTEGNKPEGPYMALVWDESYQVTADGKGSFTYTFAADFLKENCPCWTAAKWVRNEPEGRGMLIAIATKNGGEMESLRPCSSLEEATEFICALP